MKYISILFVSILLLISCKNSGDNNNATHNHDGKTGATAKKDSLIYAQETHFKNIRQLTFGGDNAEAYWSFDGKSLVFQRKYTPDSIMCDQIFIGEIPEQGKDFKFDMVSTGKGRTTCSYFLHGDSTIIYASTHLKQNNCPPEPDKSNGYVWPLYPEFEIFIADKKGNIVEQLTDNNYYDAEATTSPTENKIVYTSTKSGDLELYVLDLDTKEEIQITNELGYDGGAFFSPDGKKLVWRSSRPKTDEEIKHYKDLLDRDLVEPSDMEIYVGNIDGTNIVKVTDLGGANWAPFFHPSGEKILFSSNHKNKTVPFNLYMINIDGTGLEQVTYDGVFDAFPMFSPDGTKLVFSSNRNNGGTRDTNMFMVDWVE